ncbi:VanZ like family protein [Megasphaera paucivorans]|uniref:VanZ like family protein n=1 Tax=Megasphaera paucivorans TaxID=349095 RepID=A0A1G9W319_9FIRM|nr:VanZ like family protein [Megasphaera paucivorans]
MSTRVLDALLRKVAHLSEFTLLGFVLCTSCSFFNGLNEKKVWVTLLIGLCVAVIDELLQRFSPGRSCQISDMLLDWCGVWIGLGMAVGVRKIRAVLGRDKSRCKKKRL